MCAVSLFVCTAGPSVTASSLTLVAVDPDPSSAVPSLLQPSIRVEQD